MPTRIEIELTSSRGDGTWTWRAAGAREPKGALDGALLHVDAKVGDVLRADAEVDVDGINVIAVLPPRQKREETPRLELLSAPQDLPGVTTNLVGGRDRDDRRRVPAGRARGDGGGRGDHRARGERADRSEEGAGRGPRPTSRPGPSPRAAPRGRPGRAGHPRERDAAPGAGSGSNGGRPERESTAPGTTEPARSRGRAEGSPRRRPVAPTGRDRTGEGAEASAPRPRPRRVQPGRAHRDAVLAALAPEERPIADQLAQGGLPRVRQALEEHNAKARAAGEPELPTQGVLAMAERLLPGLRAAEWRDRAEAAIPLVDEIGLRDLRTLVTSGEAAARDEEARALAEQLKAALERRTTAEREAWVAEIAHALEEGRVVRALRLSARPPDPGTRFPADLVRRLDDAASASLSPDVGAERWVAVLDAVIPSPVRRTVAPKGLPADAGPELLRAARQAASRVPGLLPLLGLERAPIPPPPGPLRSPRRNSPAAGPVITDGPIRSTGPAGSVGSDGSTGPEGRNPEDPGAGAAPAMTASGPTDLAT